MVKAVKGLPTQVHLLGQTMASKLHWTLEWVQTWKEEPRAKPTQASNNVEFAKNVTHATCAAGPWQCPPGQWLRSQSHRKLYADPVFVIWVEVAQKNGIMNVPFKQGKCTVSLLQGQNRNAHHANSVSTLWIWRTGLEEDNKEVIWQPKFNTFLSIEYIAWIQPCQTKQSGHFNYPYRRKSFSKSKNKLGVGSLVLKHQVDAKVRPAETETSKTWGQHQPVTMRGTRMSFTPELETGTIAQTPRDEEGKTGCLEWERATNSL